MNTKPMCRPTWSKELPDLGWAKFVRGSFLESGTGQVWRRVDLKLDVRFAGRLAFDDLGTKTLFTILAIVGELTQPVPVDSMNLSSLSAWRRVI